MDTNPMISLANIVVLLLTRNTALGLFIILLGVFAVYRIELPEPLEGAEPCCISHIWITD